MASTNFYCFCFIPMEKSSANKNQRHPFNHFSAFFRVILFHKFLTSWVSCINTFFSRYWYPLRSQFETCHCQSRNCRDEKKSRGFEFCSEQSCFNEKKDEEEEDDGESLYRDEMEMVMRNLTLFCSPESEELPPKMGSGDLSGVFEEKEPSLEEVKEAFDVFDENGDGFIDAMELQRVLCILGMKEGSELENCSKMIKKFDQNGDGRIDFKEFVKFMETSFVES